MKSERVYAHECGRPLMLVRVDLDEWTCRNVWECPVCGECVADEREWLARENVITEDDVIQDVVDGLQGTDD